MYNTSIDSITDFVVKVAAVAKDVNDIFDSYTLILNIHCYKSYKLMFIPEE